MTRDDLVRACRLPEPVQQGSFGFGGLWEVRRHTCGEKSSDLWDRIRVKLDIAPYTSWTVLHRWTEATLNQSAGEPVMDDTPREIKRHMPILLRGHGRILVSGLGMGCVIRGLLAKSEVEHVDVVEIDRAILERFGPEFDGDPRVTLHHDDAEAIRWPARTRWDFAWHDVWSDESAGGDPLDLIHVRLLARYESMATRQGVWMLDRRVKQRCPIPLLDGTGGYAGRAA